MLCIIVPKDPNFRVKMKYCDFCPVGRVLSPSLGRALSLTLFMKTCPITYKQNLQMIIKPTGDQGSPRSLLQ